MNHTPDQVRQSIVHVLDEWADTTGHLPIDWLRSMDRAGCIIRSTVAGPVPDVQRRQEICAGIAANEGRQDKSVLRTFRR